MYACVCFTLSVHTFACVHRYPELRGVVSLAAVKAILDVPQDTALQQAALRKLFVSYMTAKPAIVRTQVSCNSNAYTQTCLYVFGVCGMYVRMCICACSYVCTHDSDSVLRVLTQMHTAEVLIHV
jgi:methyl coenzyme M reductase beta subunit